MKGKEEEMDYTPVETISLAPNIILESIRDPHRRHCNDVWLVGRSGTPSGISGLPFRRKDSSCYSF